MSNSALKEWTTDELVNFCDVVGGGTPDRSINEYWGGQVPWASPTEITSRTSKYISNTTEGITQLGLEKSSAKLHPVGTVLMTSRASIGYVAINTVPMATNQGFQSLRCKDGTLADYMYQYITWIRPELEGMSAGSTFSEISSASVKRLRVTLPPLPEQQKIATILSSVDDVIEKTRTQIDKLKDLKTGMMQELLTKGIGHTEFKDSPLGLIPISWEVLPLENIVENIIDCEHKTAPYVESSEYLVVRTSNVRDGELVYDGMKFTTEAAFEDWTKRAVPSVGDVLFTREAPAGESCMVPANVKVCMGQRLVLLRPNLDKVNPEYFSLYLTSEAAKLAIYELSIGTTVSRINIEDIKRIPCVVPSVREQQEIQLKISAVQSLISSKSLLLKSNESVKKALMQDLLTGKVRVI